MQGVEISNISNKLIKYTADLGRAAASSLFPNEFEYYLLSLELTYFTPQGKEKTLRYFSFPVMPNSITQSEPQITNVKKNYGGVTVLNSPTFIPKDISIQGNFGRTFRILLGNVMESFASIDNASSPGDAISETKKLFNKTFSRNGDIDLITNEMSQFVKTGYGSVKVLQAICEQSHQIDFKRPRRLYLHNPALGHSYLVKVTNLTLLQNLQNNMIWNYNLQLKAISPSENLDSGNENKLKDSLAAGVIQSGVNKLASSVSNLIS